MWVIAGLGNPGPLYSKTRHNIGFMVLDRFASSHGFPWEERRGLGTIGSHVSGETRILLVKPQTYMNRSGEAVGSMMDASRAPIESLIVVHDDMDLPFETIKLKGGGGSGGHKGIESILWQLGSDRFLRVKMGIGRPGAGEPPEEYVLGSFPAEQAARLPGFVSRGAEALDCILEKGMDRAMNLFNARMRGEGETERGAAVEE